MSCLLHEHISQCSIRLVNGRLAGTTDFNSSDTQSLVTGAMLLFHVSEVTAESVAANT